MYTILNNVQIIISLLKEYKVKHLVLSPGSRNVPFVHSVENDSDFTCYSVTDERSAAYFALGLAEELDEPVVLSCTSSTACSNYLPAVQEAKEKGVQLILLTADRDPYYREQMENQMIIQPEMYGFNCKKSVNLPIVNNEHDFWYCERLVNEALLELDHNGKGPVQINFPAVTGFTKFPNKKLPKCRVIKRIDDKFNNWSEIANELTKYNKILLLFGSNNGYSASVIENIERFFEKYNCTISVEHMSNLKCKGSLSTYLATESMSDDESHKYIPDLLITFGGNFSSDFKNILRNNYKNINHWRVAEDGKVVDTFKALNIIFKCKTEVFFEKINSIDIISKNDLNYYNLWVKKLNSIKFPDLKFTNFQVIKTVSSKIPENSLLHLGILNSTRMMQFYNLKKNIKVYSNLGAYGIDGSLSTFLGQASSTNGLAFIVLGDLSYFYDLNANLINNIGSNVRIILINNGGGGEFKYIYGASNINPLEKHICAGHKLNAQNWCKSTIFDYNYAHNQVELDEHLKKFISRSEKPIILEVFTDLDKDGDILRQFYEMNCKRNYKNKIKHNIKQKLKKGYFWLINKI